MIPRNPFWPRHAFAFKIGDSLPKDPLAGALGLGRNLFPNSGTPGLGSDGNAGAAIDSLPVPLPKTPVGANDPVVLQAENDFARDNLMKKSIRRTILAGDTGGFNPKAANAPGVANPPVSFKPKLG